MDIANDVRERALKVAANQNLKTVFVNDKGEVFTRETLASHSVGGDKARYDSITTDTSSDTVLDGKVEASIQRLIAKNQPPLPAPAAPAAPAAAGVPAAPAAPQGPAAQVAPGTQTVPAAAVIPAAPAAPASPAPAMPAAPAAPATPAAPQAK